MKSNFGTVFACSHAALGLVTMIFFSIYAEYSLYVAVLHALLIYSIYGFLFVFLNLPTTYSPSFIRVVFCLLSSLLILLYLTNFLSNHFWHNNVSAQFIFKYGAALPLLMSEIEGARAAILVLLLLVFLLNHYLYKYIFNTKNALIHKSSFKDLGLPVFMCFAIGMTLSISFERTNPGVWEGEPLTSLFLSAGNSNYVTLQSLQNNGRLLNTPAAAADDVYPNIIFMHLDAMRSDRMSLYGHTRITTPNIDRLVKSSGMAIENAFSICSESICGMMSALASHRVWKNQTSDLIHQHLKKNGYTNYLIGTGDFGWEGVDRYLEKDADYFIRADKERDYNIHDDQIIVDAVNTLPYYDGSPTFFFLRYMSPHPTGLHYERFKLFSPHGKSLFSFLKPALEGDVVRNAYDNGLVQVDHFVNEVVEKLDAKGYLQKYIIVIYGDHGEALGEHGYFGHYKGLYQEEINVPIIFLSNQDLSTISTRYATLNDMYPTILELAKLPLQQGLDGVSLINVKDNQRYSFHESRTGIYALTTNKKNTIFKYIWNSKNNKGQLFELVSDKYEKYNLMAEYPDDVRNYHQLLLEYFEL